MNNTSMTHIILLDGKLWKVDLPDKPDVNRFLPHFEEDREYNRAYSLALENKLEVENMYDLESILFDPETHEWWLMTSPQPTEIKENEPIKWEGTVVKVFQYHSSKKHYHDAGWVDCDESQFNSIKKTIPECPLRIVVRLIAPVKEENSDMPYIPGTEFKGTIGPTRGTKSDVIIPSEQENQEAIQEEIFDVSFKYTRDPAFLVWLFNTFNFTRK